MGAADVLMAATSLAFACACSSVVVIEGLFFREEHKWVLRNPTAKSRVYIFVRSTSLQIEALAVVENLQHTIKVADIGDEVVHFLCLLIALVLDDITC